jgi:hypothetical protein
VPVVVTQKVHCSTEVARLWPLIADTGYLNRAAGLAPFQLVPVDDATASRYRVRTR